MKCDALFIVEPNKMEIRQAEIPDEPRFDEVQIELMVCGICAWDSHLYQGQNAEGPMPYQFGHEGVGIIRKVGEGVTDFKPGDKVFTANGGNRQMAKFINSPATACARIPDDVTDYEKWVCEPTCCIVNLLNKTNIQPGDRVVLVGAGYMGLLTLQGLNRGSQAGFVTVYEPKPELRERAKQYGPAYIFDPNSAEGQAHAQELIHQGGADIVIEFSASQSGYDLATSLCRKQDGKLIMGAWHRRPMSFDGTRWHQSGLTIMNLSPDSNRFYNITTVKQTGILVQKGVYTPGDLVTHVADYHDCDDLFRKSITKEDGYLKGVIKFA